MLIQSLSLHPYEIPLASGQIRSGALIKIVDQNENWGIGDIAPLPKWSRETLEDAIEQIRLRKEELVSFDWNGDTFLNQLKLLDLLPSVSFGLESALFSILDPLPEFSIPTSALLMGSREEILSQAALRLEEGFTSAKLKVSNLKFDEAAELIHRLKDKFRLRIDVNRAWTTEDSLRFFSQFSLDTFDYVEEPFQNHHDLSQFLHPLAVDESFPQDLSLSELESLPTLKALIYKPTIQGGMLGCLPLLEWAKKRGISLVLSSSFESDLGLAQIAALAHRLSLSSPVGIGTYHHMNRHLTDSFLSFFGSFAHVLVQEVPNGSRSKLHLSP